ncbi:MAG: hypothetical protein RLZZ387_4810 [Chloroflexota bacterium]|jgi:hypothetical protein
MPVSASRRAQALVTHADPHERARHERQPAQETGRASYRNIRAEALELCRQAIALVEARALPQEADDYASFVLFLASRVARAASEGGLLGLGGEKVSPTERATLREIATALGVQVE